MQASKGSSNFGIVFRKWDVITDIASWPTSGSQDIEKAVENFCGPHASTVLFLIEKASWGVPREVKSLPLDPLESAAEAKDRPKIKAALTKLSKQSIGDINSYFDHYKARKSST